MGKIARTTLVPFLEPAYSAAQQFEVATLVRASGSAVNRRQGQTVIKVSFNHLHHIGEHIILSDELRPQFESAEIFPGQIVNLHLHQPAPQLQFREVGLRFLAFVVAKQPVKIVIDIFQPESQPVDRF